MPKEKQKKTKEHGNGQGTVYRLPSGRYRWQFTLGYDVNGKRDSVGGTEDTKTLADIALSQAITDNARGLLSKADNVTLQTYAEKWLSHQKELRPTTQLAYQREIGYALNHLGNLKVKDIKPTHIKDCLMKLSEMTMQGGRGKGQFMSGRTLGMVRTRLKSIFQEAVADQIIYANPCNSVKRLKTKTAETVSQVLDPVQMTRLHELGLALYEAGICRLFPAVFTAASLGLRRAEVFGLRWQDVDLEKGVIHIRQTITTPKGKPHFGEPKTQHSKRTIPLPATLKNILLLQQQKQNLERERAMDAWNDTGAVFATETGEYTHPDNMERALNHIVAWSDLNNFTVKRCRSLPVSARAKLELIIKSGEKLPDINPHDLRHTAATLMLRRGVPVEVVSRILGHSKVSVTLDVYRHVLDSEKQQVMVDLFDTPLPPRTKVVQLN